MPKLGVKAVLKKWFHGYGKGLVSQVEQAAANLEFEKAAGPRDPISQLKNS